MVLFYVWSLLWFQQKKIFCIGTVFCVEFIVVTATLDEVQYSCEFWSFFVVTETVD